MVETSNSLEDAVHAGIGNRDAHEPTELEFGQYLRSLFHMTNAVRQTPLAGLLRLVHGVKDQSAPTARLTIFAFRELQMALDKIDLLIAARGQLLAWPAPTHDAPIVTQ